MASSVDKPLVGSCSLGRSFASLNEGPPQRVDVVGHHDAGAVTCPNERDVQQTRQPWIRWPFVAVILIGLQMHDRGVGLSALCLMQVHDLHRVWAKAGVAPSARPEPSRCQSPAGGTKWT
jgi:hypothetical protein